MRNNDISTYCSISNDFIRFMEIWTIVGIQEWNEKGEMEMTLYMAVTPDEYELPIAVADGPTELARKFNLNKSTVLGSIIRKQNGKRRGIRFERVEIDE